MTTPTFTRHTNLLADLVDELDLEARQAKRRADAAGVAAAGLTGGAQQRADFDSTRDRGIQDTLTNVVGRLRSVLIAPLSCIVDVGEVFDEVEARLGGRDATSSTKTVTPHTAARVAAEVIDGRNVRGARP